MLQNPPSNNRQKWLKRLKLTPKIKNKKTKKSSKMKVISLYEKTPNQNLGPQTNLNDSPKGPKRLKMIPKNRNSKSVKTKKCYKMKVINLYE